MPVTTRNGSKRNSLENNDIQEAPTKKLFIKLVDITNSKSKKNGQISRTFSADNVLYAAKAINADEVKSKKLNSSLRSHATTNSLPSQNSGSQNASEDVLKAMRIVKKVMETNYKSAESLLQLDIIPNCLYDIKNCYQNHKNNFTRQAHAENVFVLKLYIAEERHFQFFQYIRRHMIANNLFPGTEICLNIFNEIMKYKSKDKNLSTQFVLSELHDVFITILNTFPPCHIQDSYLKIFTSKVKIDGLPEKREILPTVLDIIHDLIFDDGSDQFDKSFSVDFNKNFYLWDMENNENSAFTNLSRVDRFNRVFLILNLIVRLLEYDTAVFVVRYSNHFASTIKEKGVQPIICSVIWQGFEEMMTINTTVKKIISIYVAMNALNYPADKIKTVAKLLNLITNVMNLYEYSDETVQYPIAKALTSNLVNEIQKTLENSNYISMDLWLKIIENLRSPMIRMMLSNQLYSKIAGHASPVSLAVPFKAIYSKNFMKFGNIAAPEVAEKTEKYPRYDHKRVPKKFEVSQNHFIKLLMLYTDAVIRNFHLQDITTEMNNPEDKDTSTDVEMKPAVPHKFNLASFQKQIKNIDLNEKVTLRSIDLNFRNMVHIRLNKDNCSFYRNEIKNFPLIIRLIERCHEKYGSQFKEWMENLKKFQ